MARRAEELGYDMIAIPEHFVVPTAHVELSGPHYFHSTVAQAYIAGATQSIRVNSSVTLLPLQQPVILAKALSTADWMSNGRITVTFGVGWDAEEFRILGVPFHECRGNHRSARLVIRTRRDDVRSTHPTGEGLQRLPRLRAVGDRGS